MAITLLLYNLKLNILIFFYSLNSSLIIFIRTYAVNYRNALDRLRVRMNILSANSLPPIYCEQRTCHLIVLGEGHQPLSLSAETGGTVTWNY